MLRIAGDRLGGVTRERARQLRNQAGIPKRKKDTSLGGWADWIDVLCPKDVQILTGTKITSQGHAMRSGGIKGRARKRLALALKRDGWRQIDIASMLGIGQAGASEMLARAEGRRATAPVV